MFASQTSWQHVAIYVISSALFARYGLALHSRANARDIRARNNKIISLSKITK